jgi:hypothetical protein
VLLTNDNSDRPLKEQAHVDFVREQRDVEVELGQFSPAFGPELLPGMHSMPIGVVPKPRSTNLRMIVDQSAEPWSQNSLIPKAARSVRLDNIQDLGRILRRVRADHPDACLVLFKSDASRAYRTIPMHPLWQIRQVVTIGQDRHVDRCNNFGNGAGGRVHWSFVALVLWIAIFMKFIEDLLGYVDDDFSWDFEWNLEWYAPYGRYYPGKQVRLLELWDELGIPHEERKQQWGTPLTVIGFDVDPNAMTVTMLPESRNDLLVAICAFAKSGQRRPLREFQRLAGWLNWALNAYPLLRPGLSTLYTKMAGKDHPHQPVFVSKGLCDELDWVAERLESSDGVHMLTSEEWCAGEADITFYTDACPSGLGIWEPRGNTGFQHAVKDSRRPIFYLEALAVVSALHIALCLTDPPPKRVVIYSDNMNTVDIFNSLHAKPEYNPLLLTAADYALKSKSSFRVFHIAGETNTVADALSRFNAGVALSAAPGLTVSSFEPPRLTLGAAEK